MPDAVIDDAPLEWLPQAIATRLLPLQRDAAITRYQTLMMPLRRRCYMLIAMLLTARC